MKRVRTQPRKVPSQPRAKATVDVMLEAAERVLEREGEAALTTNRLAEVAGVSIGSVYQYFPSKDAIVAALLERHAAEYHRELEALLAASAGRPIEEIVHDGLHRFVALLTQRRIHAALAQQVDDLGLRAIVETWLPRWVATVRGFLAGRTDVRVRDLDLAASMLISAAEGVVRSVALVGLPADRNAWVEETARLLVGFLRGGG